MRRRERERDREKERESCALMKYPHTNIYTYSGINIVNNLYLKEDESILLCLSSDGSMKKKTFWSALFQKMYF